MNKNSNLEKELAAIHALHQKDMTASKAGDFETLRSLMSEDAVVMPPGSPSIRGKAELDANFDGMQEAMRQVEVVEYDLEFEEVQVVGDYAFEWGTIRGAMHAKAGGEIERSTYKVMRILQKQPNGEWKVHRTIWNDNS